MVIRDHSPGRPFSPSVKRQTQSGPSTWPGSDNPHLTLTCPSYRQQHYSCNCVVCLHPSFVMSFSRHDFTLSRLHGPITGGVLEAPGPSQTTSTGSSCPSIISAERRADGRSASCGAHNRGASAIRRAAFISNLCVEKAQVSALAEETQQKRRGKKAGRQLFSLIAPIIGLHQGEKKTKT